MSEILAGLALATWRGAGRLVAPLVTLLLAARERAGKEDPARRGERRGCASLPRPQGRLVWVHAASVGETMSVVDLVERIAATGIRVLVTSGTVTSAAIAGRRLPAGAVHQYVPVDVAPWVERFLDHWRPEAALFVESEIWPATLAGLDARGIPRIAINARLSARSARRWARLDAPARALFGGFALVLAQSAADAERFRGLGARRVEVSGNLKFDGAPLAADAAELARLAAAIAGRPVWIAASTHPGEEERVAEAHRAARAHLPGLLTISAPRHPARGEEVRAVHAAAGLGVATRSRGETPEAACDVYLADTIGEMGLLYRLAPIAFVGGSLVPVGGHNPIEPARLGAAILHGPHVGNFADLYDELDAVGGARRVSDAADLAEAIVVLAARPEIRAAMLAGADTVVGRSTGALERTLAALAPWLAPPTEGGDRCPV